MQHYPKISDYLLDPKPSECNPGDSRQTVGAALPSGPLICYLELTPTCNNRCYGCANNEFITNFNIRTLKPGLRQRPLNGNEWDQILDKLDFSVKLINLSGGEPTLHPEFETIAASINRREINFYVFTSARWPNPQRLVSFLEKLPHFKGFLISLHGATPEAHETFTGIPGSFKETIANIALATGSGLPVSTSIVITHKNVLELEAIADLSNELGANEAVFNRYLIPSVREEQPIPGGTLKQMAPTRDELRKAVQVIEGLRKYRRNNFQISYGPCIPQCFISSSSQGCSAGETFFVVDPWGNAKPCIHTTLLCGNLLEQDVLHIWNNSRSLEFWRGLIPTGCSSCAMLSQCRTGCRAMALASGTGHDPLMGRPIPLFSSSSLKAVANPRHKTSDSP